MQTGRPTTYDPDVLFPLLKQFANDYEPWTVEGGKKVPNLIPGKFSIVKYLQAHSFPICRTTFWEWEEQHPEFADAVKKTINSIYPEALQNAAMIGVWDKTFSIFSAKNRMGWSDKQEIDHVFREPILVKAMSGEVVETLKHG